MNTYPNVRALMQMYRVFSITKRRYHVSWVYIMLVIYVITSSTQFKEEEKNQYYIIRSLEKDFTYYTS